DVGDVSASLNAGRELVIDVPQVERSKVGRSQTEGPAAPVPLADLIALERVVEEVREVGEQVEVVMDRVRVEPLTRVCPGTEIRRRDAEPAGLAAQRRIDRAQPLEEAVLHGAARDLIDRVPLVRVGHARDRQQAVSRTPGLSHEAAQLPEILRTLPWTVVQL